MSVPGRTPAGGFSGNAVARIASLVRAQRRGPPGPTGPSGSGSSGGVTSIASDGSLLVSSPTGAVDVQVNPGFSNTWQAEQHFSAGLNFSNQGTAAPQSTLDFFSSGTFAFQYTGPWASPSPTFTIPITRSGNDVAFNLPSYAAVASSSQVIQFSEPLPLYFRPAVIVGSFQNQPAWSAAVEDGGTAQSTPGMLAIEASTGVMLLYLDWARSSFTGSGGTGLTQDCPVSFVTNQ